VGLSRGARLYLRLQERLGWLPPGPRALHQAIWLGLLDPPELNRITRFHYGRPGGFESEAHNLGGLWPWEADVVRGCFAGRHRLLVAGAGGGREAIALVRLGHAVTACDFCPALTAACRRHAERAGVQVRVIEAPPDGLPSGLGIYDGIYAGRGFYHHIPGRGRRIAFLTACRRHLVPGGPLFLSDFFTRPASGRPGVRAARIANGIRRLRGSPEAIEQGDWLSDCLQHAFTPREISSELGEAGFRMERYAVSPFGPGSRLGHAVGIAR
jgi:SAM-dependent methyltransferase